MKKILTYFIAGAAIAALSTSLLACNTSDNGHSEIQPVITSGVIANFFDNPETIKALGNAIFKFVGGNEPIGSCVMINSADQLPELPGLEYPEIAFDSHTLVFGVVQVGEGNYIASRKLNVNPDVAKMSIEVKSKDDDLFYAAIIHPNYFWGLYPKINASTIHTNVTNKYILFQNGTRPLITLILPHPHLKPRNKPPHLPGYGNRDPDRITAKRIPRKVRVAGRNSGLISG